MIILAIDPGYERMGVAVVTRVTGRDTALYSTCLRTATTLPFSERLAVLGKELERLITEWKPSGIALEKLFFAKNQKTATAIAEVRGMLLYIAGKTNLPVYEYAPLQIKIAVTGWGAADKRQVSQMVKKLLTLDDTPRLDDEYDALAVGITCLAIQRSES